MLFLFERFHLSMDACTENLEVVVDLAIPYKIVKRRFIHSRHFQREIVRTWRRYKHVSLLSVNKFILSPVQARVFDLLFYILLFHERREKKFEYQSCSGNLYLYTHVKFIFLSIKHYKNPSSKYLYYPLIISSLQK